MNDQLARRLLRQIKVLNFLIVFFAFVFLAVFAAAGFFGYKAVQEIRDAKSTLNTVQNQAKDSLNIQDELCNGSASALIRSNSDVCSN